MILVIDTGNTNTVIGIVDDSNQVVNSFRIPTDRVDTSDGYAAKIKTLLDLVGIGLDAFEGAVISSVVPSVTLALKKAVYRLFKMEALVVGQNVDSGLKIDIVGGAIAPDLECTAVAVKEYYPLPSIIIDMGTATTVTVVDENAVYIGGVIYPGVITSLNALVDKTSLLPSIELAPTERAIANETVMAIQAGVVYGAAGSIDGIIDHFVEEMDVKPASIVATGGLGRLICKNCRHDIIFDDDLLLRGMEVIWNQTKSGERK